MSLLWPYFLNFSDSSQSDLSCLPAGEYQSGASTLGSEGRKEVKAQEEECLGYFSKNLASKMLTLLTWTVAPARN